MFGRDLRGITKDADKQRSAKCSRNGIIEKKGGERAERGPEFHGRSKLIIAGSYFLYWRRSKSRLLQTEWPNF